MFYHCDKLPCRRQESTLVSCTSCLERTIFNPDTNSLFVWYHLVLFNCMLYVKFGKTKTSSLTARSDPGFLNGNHGRWCHKGTLLYRASMHNIIHHVRLTSSIILVYCWYGWEQPVLNSVTPYSLSFNNIKHKVFKQIKDNGWGIARRYWTNMVDPLRRAGRLVMVR